MSPLVTVIIPSYNHDRFITETIESVMNQTYKQIQLIVLDDGSKDNSPQIIEKLAQTYGFEYVLKKNEGVCATLNQGIDLAKGELLTFIASDDYMPASRIQEQVDFLQKNPEVDIVAGSVHLIDIDGKMLKKKEVRHEGRLTFSQMLDENLVFAPTAMLRKNVYTRFGKYNPNYAFEDYYLWLKVLKMGGVIENVRNMWAYYRINYAGYEKRFNWYLKGNEQILQEYAPDPSAVRSIERNYLKHGAKMALFIGKGYLENYPVEFKRLSAFWKIAIQIVARLPVRIRHWLLHALMKNV